MKLTIIKVIDIDEPTTSFTAQGKIEAFWMLSTAEVAACLELEVACEDTVAKMAARLKAESSTTQPPESGKALWNPGIYLRNAKSKLHEEDVSYRVTYHDNEGGYYIVARSHTFAGDFHAQPVAGEDVFPSLRLGIEVCVIRNDSEVEALTPRHIQVFKPWNFKLKSDYFLEKPQECPAPWRDADNLDELWAHDRKRSYLLRVVQALTDQRSSSTSARYAQLYFYVQVRRQSDEQHFRKAKSNATPLDTEIRLAVYKVLAINVITTTEPAHTFQADVNITATWEDFSLNQQCFANQETGLELDRHSDAWRDRAKHLLQAVLATAVSSSRNTFRTQSKSVFIPRLELRNCYKSESLEEWFTVDVYETAEAGSMAATIMWCRRCLGHFVERLELHRFPLDTQELAIELTDFGRGITTDDGDDGGLIAALRNVNVDSVANAIRYIDRHHHICGHRRRLRRHDAEAHECGRKCTQIFEKASPTRFRFDGERSFVNSQHGFALSGEYVISSDVFHRPAFTHPKLSSSNRSYPSIVMQLRVRRKWFWWVAQLVLPIFLITLFAGSTLCVEASASVTDRLQVTLAMVTTMASYTFVMQQAVPKASYFTLLDFYVIACLLTMAAVVAQNVWLGGKSEERLDAAIASIHEETENAAWFDEHDRIQSNCRWLFGGWLFLLWHSICVGMLWREHIDAADFVAHKPQDYLQTECDPVTRRHSTGELSRGVQAASAGAGFRGKYEQL